MPAVLSSSGDAPFRFAISATFTAEPIQPVLEFWARRLNAEFEVRFAPFNQVHQTLLDLASVFAANRHGLNVVLLRFDDLGQRDDARLANGLHLAASVRKASAELAAPLLVCVCPSAVIGAETHVADWSAEIAAMFDDTPAVQFISAEQVAAWYPVPSPHDAAGLRLGGIPYTETYFCALGSAIVRHAHTLSMRPYKVLALDCDNTLWKGICGEDGPAGVTLDQPRLALQRFAIEQREAGMLLAIASKNNQQDVWDTFAAQAASMPLAPRHFSGWRINWESKAENLAALAREFDLGLDSFIFIDDNPMECAEVSERVPEVLALPLPENIFETSRFLAHIWAFDRPVVTEEDRRRNTYYEQARKFGREARAAANLEEFLAALELRVSVAPLEPDKFARAAQLTQRTNQFNVSGVRRSEAEMAALRGGGTECWTVAVADRFGEYGVTGLVLFAARGRELAVDTLLLSCRVLGRGVEHRLMEMLGAEARRRGLDTVAVPLVPTARNAPARQFLEAIGSPCRGHTEAAMMFRFPVESLTGLSPKAEAPPESDEQGETPPPPLGPVRRPVVDYGGIARLLATADDILEAMRRERAGSHQAASGMSGTERRLADVWASLLGVPHLSAADNFFDLGGHSLLAVQLLLRVRESFGVELAMEDVYTASATLEDMAARIDAARLSGMDPEAYSELVRGIESMSDEQVREALEREEGNAL
jgi:FkbH-like protein